MVQEERESRREARSVRLRGKTRRGPVEQSVKVKSEMAPITEAVKAGERGLDFVLGLGCGELGKVFRHRKNKTNLGSGLMRVAAGARGLETREQSGRPEGALLGSSLHLTALKGGTAPSTEDQRVAGPTLGESTQGHLETS